MPRRLAEEAQKTAVRALYIAVVLLYFDLRVRKEGLDLDQLAQQTSPGPAPA